MAPCPQMDPDDQQNAGGNGDPPNPDGLDDVDIEEDVVLNEEDLLEIIDVEPAQTEGSIYTCLKKGHIT